MARNLVNYTYTKDDFQLKRRYHISNDYFAIKKIKYNQKNILFLESELPALLYLNKENPIISNFNAKEEVKIVDLQMLNCSIFIFKDKIVFGSLSNSQSQNIISKQISNQMYNLYAIKDLNLFAVLLEEKQNSNNKIIFSFVILDKHLNEVAKYKFDTENEICTTFTEIKAHFTGNSKFFALGTGYSENSYSEPEFGHIYLLQLDENMKLRKIAETETKGGVYKIASQENKLYVGIASTLFIYSIETPLIKSNNQGMEVDNVIEYKSISVHDYDIKLLRKSNDFTVINEILCHKEYVLVSDIYKSVTLFKYDSEKDKLTECCRDFNPTWCFSMVDIEDNMYIVSDIDGNIISMRRELYPKNDEEKYK